MTNYDINANMGTDFNVTVMDANYDELPNPADPDNEDSCFELRGDLTDPSDLRKLADFMELATAVEGAIIAFDID